MRRWLFVSNSSDGANGAYQAIYCVCPTVELPSTLEIVDTRLFGLFNKSTIICHATTPPGIYIGPGNYGSHIYYEPQPASDFSDSYDQMKDMTLYVPAKSVETYKATEGWSRFGTILPIEE